MNRKLILYTLAFTNFIHIVDSMLIMPLGDIFINLFDLTAQEFSFLVGAYAFAAFIASIISMFFIDRFDRKHALLFVFTGFSVGTLLCAFTNTYISLVILRFLTGFFGGVIGAIVLSIVSDVYAFKERGFAMGILMTAFSVASALGVPIGIYLAATLSWRYPFIIIGSIGLCIALFIFVKFPKMTMHFDSIDIKPGPRKTLANIIGDRNQVNALVAGYFLVLGHFMIIPFISPYLIKNVGLTQLEISYQFLFGGIATIITGPIIGKLTDKIGVMKVFLTMMFLSFIPTILITQMQFAPLIFAISCTTLFFVTASGRMIPPQTLISAAATPTNRGSFMSMKSALQQLAIFSASIVSGWIVYIDSNDLYVNYDKVGYIAICLCLLTIYFVNKIKVAKGN